MLRVLIGLVVGLAAGLVGGWLITMNNVRRARRLRREALSLYNLARKKGENK